MSIESVVAGAERLCLELISGNPHPPRRRHVVSVDLSQDSQSDLIGYASVVQSAPLHEQAPIVDKFLERRVYVRTPDRQVLRQILDRRAAPTGALDSSLYALGNPRRRDLLDCGSTDRTPLTSGRVCLDDFTATD